MLCITLGLIRKVFQTLYPVLLQMLLLPCVDVFVEDLYISFRFVSKQRKTSNALGISSLIFGLQERELRLSVCVNTFRNLKEFIVIEETDVPYTNNNNYLNGRDV